MKKFLKNLINKLIAPYERLPKIGFVIDATASRAKTWQAAQEIQVLMFNNVLTLHKTPILLKVVHFGGFSVKGSAWHKSADDLSAYMQKVKCRAGITRIKQALSLYLTEGKNLKAICLIGDDAQLLNDMDDNWKELSNIAAQLGGMGIKVFTFLEGDNQTARDVFQMIARLSGGAFASFGSKSDLSEMCQFVASFAALEAQALTQFINGGHTSEQVKSLAQQLAITYQKN